MRFTLLVLFGFCLSGIHAQDIIPLIDIQGETAISPYLDQEVTINAKVTEYFGDYWFMQDEFGAWNGLMVYEPTLFVPPNPPWWDDPRQPEVGDELTITGTIVEVDGNTQMINAVLVEQTEFWLATPAGTAVTAAESQDESLEGTRIRMFEATVVTAANAEGHWIITDGVGELTCIGIDDEADPFPGDVYDVYGASCEINGQYYLHVGDIDVISLSIEETASVPNLILFPNPSDGSFEIQSSKDIQQLDIFNRSGQLLQRQFPERTKVKFEDLSYPAGTYFARIYSDGHLIHRTFYFW